MRTIIIVFLILLIIFVLLVCAVSIYLAFLVAKPKKHTMTEGMELAKNQGSYDQYLQEPRVEYIIKSFDTYELHTCLLQNENKTNKYVILSHGYTMTKLSMLKHVKMYKNLGFNVILYDNRGHGENNLKQKCTLGKIESKDLIKVIEDTYNRYGSDIYLGLQGESMGSGLEIMSLKYKPNVRFIINDCGYGTLSHVLKFKAVHDYHLPSFLVDVASVFSKIFFGYSYKEVRPILNLKDNYIPICFITGDKDMFVPAKESISMYLETKGYKELHLFENVDHAMARETNTDRYDDIVKQFLDTINQ